MRHGVRPECGPALSYDNLMGHPPAALPSPRCPRYLSLDLWRGVACLAVVLHHATLFSPFWLRERIPDDGRHNPASWVVAATAHLWVGVPLFFVISGYCISATADATRRRDRPLRTYFVRRFRRIYPPYWAAVALLALLVVVADAALWPGLWTGGPIRILPPDRLTGWQWLGNLTLTETWRPHVVGGPGWYYHAMMWTLCYEEQFYAVVGLLLWLAPRRFFAATAAVTALTFVARYLLIRAGRPADGFFFDGYWLAFAAGVLVYYYVNYADRRGRWMALAVLAAALAWFGRAHFPVRSVHSNVGESAVVAFAFALLLALLRPWDERLANARLLRPLTFCGTICYSLYLIHWPVVFGVSHGLHRLGVQGDTAIVLVTVPLCVAASVACSWVFYRLVERRFLNTPPKSASATV